jgi:hypothetical protein
MGKKSWEERIPEIRLLVEQKVSLEKIGSKYGVSKQRLYQVLSAYGIDTYRKKKRSRYGSSPKHLWLDKVLMAKKVPVLERHRILEVLHLPDRCPVLGYELKYVSGRAKGDKGAGEGCFGSSSPDSPSIDQIKPGQGYVLGNIQVISWRANRLKSDSTPEEMMKIALYMKDLNT